jgi:hypothetical protein
MKNLGMFLMKMTSRIVFSFVAAGLLLSAFSFQGLAQTSTTPKPLSKKALKALCKKTPSDSRCPQTTPKTPDSSSLKDSSTTPPSSPIGGSSDPMKPAGDTTAPPPAGGSDPMKPAGDTTAPPPAGGSDPMKPAGDTTAPGGTSKP